MTLAELIIKISCDSSDAEAGIKKTEEQTGKLGSKFSSITGKIGKAGKVIGTAVAAASAAIGKLAFDATKAYAEYEQQVGGVQKLFGDAWQTVVDNAKKAYKTAGVDANTYMQNVTSFSAALIKSLGGDTKKAAEIADRAMRDMSDNANTFGTDITSIQMAYQGFAKENYTMLDNLKLGFAGTKQGAKDLIKEASKLGDIQKKLGVTIDANSLSYENLINAISVYQEYLGISGTTAKEAANTIQGSLGMMKAAWTNLQIALADPEGNVNEAMLNLIDSAKAFAMNAAPVFKNAIKGIGSVIKEFAPVIAKELPGLINDLLPDLISAGVDLVGGLTQAVIDNAPMLIDGVGQIVQKIGDTLKASDNPIFQAVGEVISFIGDLIRDPEGTLTKAWETLWTGIQEVASGIWESIKGAASSAWEAIKGFWTENIAGPIKEAWGAISKWFNTNVWQPISGFFTTMWTTISELWGDVSTSISDAWKLIAEWFDLNVWQPISNFFTTMWTSVSELWGDISTAVSDAWKLIAEWFNTNVFEPISNFFTTAWTTISELWGDISTAVSDAWTSIATWFDENVWQPISDFFAPMWTTISDLWGDISTAISTAWTSIATWMNDNVWQPISDFFDPMWTTISDLWGDISTAVTTAWTDIATWFDENVWQPIASFFSPVWETIKQLWTDISTNISNAWSVVEGILEPIITPIKTLFEGVVSVVSNIWGFLSNIFGLGDKTINVTTNYITTGTPPSLSSSTPDKPLSSPTDLAPAVADLTSPQTKDNIKKPTYSKKAKGDWNVPYDDYLAKLHRGEMVLTASQARKFRDGELKNSGFDVQSLQGAIIAAIRDGMMGVQVNSYLDGRKVTDEVNRIMGSDLSARRYAT